MNPYTLPDLPYDYSALEPYISGKIMELHHGKHHAAYVKNANSVLEQLDEARNKEDLARLAALERALAFNLSGHILHSIFWRNITQKGGGTPSGDFAGAIEKDFGGFPRFALHSKRASLSCFQEFLYRPYMISDPCWRDLQRPMNPGRKL